MKRMAGLSALALIISSTSGCGWIWGPEGYFRDRGSDYPEAQQTAPMQLPPNVSTSKRLDPLLPIPRNVADDTAKGEYVVPRPQPLSAAADISAYSLQKSGDSRWIMAQNPPAEVWPVAVQFFGTTVSVWTNSARKPVSSLPPATFRRTVRSHGQAPERGRCRRRQRNPRTGAYRARRAAQH